MRLFHRTTYRGALDHALKIVQGLGMILDGITLVISLGCYFGAFESIFQRIRARRFIKKEEV